MQHKDFNNSFVNQFSPAADNTELFDSLLSGCRESYSIPASAFTNYNVKRGLRNPDGTGVMAGITKIGNAHGYIINEGDKISIDGELYYRGYNVADLIRGYTAEGRYGFEETAYLLFFGDLPTKKQLDDFDVLLDSYRYLPPRFTDDVIMKAPSTSIMNKMASSVLSLYAYDENPDETSLENMLRQSMQLLARLPIITAQAYAYNRSYFNGESLNIHNPQNNLSTAQNFLRIMRPDCNYTEEEAKLLDLCLVLHAEHGGGNNSAFTCRVVSSSGSDTYSAIASAICSLKGPKHGGANIKVQEMFECIKEGVRDWNDDDEISAFLEKLLRGEEGDHSGLIYGMGHAIYTLSDPRAVMLKKYAKKLAEGTEFEDEFALLESVERLSSQAYKNFKQTSKNICANVDLYSGLVYRMLGIPTELYTPLFAIARISGWCAHRIEEVCTGKKIIRPAYKAISNARAYLPLDERKPEL
ncbi:MAG: citrate/2-methylcitrate synthase [Clostridiales bacterium]|nr:citrate/2-methylcitrate synthase [Clostridiales bacterium]